MKNIFKEYSEAIDVAPRMNMEDNQKIQRYERHITELKRTGDDQSIMQEIKEFKDKIKAIKDSYKSGDEKKIESAYAQKSYVTTAKKRHTERKVKEKDTINKYDALSDEDKAQEAIVALNNMVKYAVQQDKNQGAFGTSRGKIPVSGRTRELREKVDSAINEIRAAYKLPAKSEIKSKLTLSEKTAARDTRFKVPEKISGIYKKYNLKGSYI